MYFNSTLLASWKLVFMTVVQSFPDTVTTAQTAQYYSVVLDMNVPYFCLGTGTRLPVIFLNTSYIKRPTVFSFSFFNF